MIDDAMVFDTLDLREVSVCIAGKNYTLREANGEAARRYRNTVLKAARLGPDGKPVSIDGMADAEMVLINQCLIDHSGRMTPIAVLAGWPSHILKKLFVRIQEISDLKESEEDTLEGLAKRRARLEKEMAETNLKLARLAPPPANEGPTGDSADPDPTAVSPESTTAG